ncbi:hypothetical protein [Faecalicoccus pleomorphus]|uniref:hypothetical protein n=1 Tax=Faecalicoccus pleomorphus TaxID=1323 RepID=UPI0029432696|nr:hypothetical protein [Faecalicoccus pleomorphus]
MLKLNNTVNGDLTIYGFDSKSNDALLKREKNTAEPYVVAWNFDFETGGWGQGHYFSHYEDAEKFYHDRIYEMEKPTKAEQIKEAELLLLEIEFEAHEIKCDKEMLEELYYNVIIKSDGSTFLNEIDVEDCLDYYFEQKERKEMEAEGMEK